LPEKFKVGGVGQALLMLLLAAAALFLFLLFFRDDDEEASFFFLGTIQNMGVCSVGKPVKKECREEEDNNRDIVGDVLLNLYV
jgi:hypothetical protein